MNLDLYKLKTNIINVREQVKMFLKGSPNHSWITTLERELDEAIIRINGLIESDKDADEKAKNM